MRIRINLLFICMIFVLTGFVSATENSNETNSSNSTNEILLTECDLLNTENGMYELTNNIIATGNCFTIDANNVTLDLQGYTIKGEDSGTGVHVKKNSNNIIIKNGMIDGFITGIRLFSSNSIEVTETKISNNIIGISLGDTSDSILHHNTFENNGIGISFYDGSNSNTIHTNKIPGIDSIDFNQNNEPIKKNVFYNNLLGRVDLNPLEGSGFNEWSISKQSGENIIGGEYIGGNYWEKEDGTGFSQTCSDSEKDGICDESYEIDQYNVDNLALTYSLLDEDPPLLDEDSPEIELISPINNQVYDLYGSNSTLVNIEFKFIVSDDSEIYSCQLVLGGRIIPETANSDIKLEEITSFFLEMGGEEKNIVWQIRCHDEKLNEGFSEVRKFRLINTSKSNPPEEEPDDINLFTPADHQFFNSNDSSEKQIKEHTGIFQAIINWFKNLFSS